MSDTYCPLPFQHLQVKPNQQIKPCCRFDLKKHDNLSQHRFGKQSLNDTVNSDFWKQMREDMLAGKQVGGCHKCYSEEKDNVSSMRQGENAKRGYTEEVKIKYLELTFGNFCNLKCRTCFADLSSTWFEEEQLIKDKYDGRSGQKDKVIHVSSDYKVEDFEFIDHIKFTGGEPMLHPNFEVLLDFLIDNGFHKNIWLDVFTNCSWFPKQRVMNKIEMFRDVRINLSIDGINEVNDYIRSPSKWSVVDECADKWLDTNFKVLWHPCISVYNIHQAIDMLEWWENKTKNREETYYTYNTVFFPSYQQPSLSPIKEELIEKFTEYLKLSDDLVFKVTFEKLISSLKRKVTDKDIEDYRDYTVDLDKLRNQNIAQTIPEAWGNYDNVGRL